MKLLVTLKAAPSLDRSQFQRLVLADAPRLLEDLPQLTGLIVNIADIDPGDAEWVRPGEARANPAAPAFDVVLEMKVADADAAGVAEAVAGRFADSAEQCWAMA